MAESEHRFQPEEGVIRYRMHFRSPPDAVFAALATDEGRSRHWAESAVEEDGEIHLVFLNGIEDRATVLERVPGERFALVYFGMPVTFDLQSDGDGGTEMTVTCRDVPEGERMELAAGWAVWLATMKAAVDFGVDIRNHDPKRTWAHGYANNG